MSEKRLIGDYPRHKKRYQDVTELLDAGINVYTTVNVQHLESLHDIVASITHVRGDPVSGAPVFRI